MKRKLFQRIASLYGAQLRCMATNNGEWQIRHENNLTYLVNQFMPSGSGIDCGTKFVWEESNPNKLVFSASFHHMNDGGFYDGWTEHKVIVTPSLTSDFDLKITGRDRNQIKEYLHEVFHSALSEEIDHDGTEYFSPELRKRQAEFKAKVASGEIV